MSGLGVRSVVAAAGVAAVVLGPTAALATEGYFQTGFSARQSALGGAGVAQSAEAMDIAINPAGIIGLPRQFQIGAALFMPFRGYTATGGGYAATGEHNSSSNYFVMPNIGYVQPIDADSAWGIAMYGNGGMNTTYQDFVNPSCAMMGGGSGVYCGGKTGVDLMQGFISADYARKFGGISFGIAPTLAIQRFSASGLSGFTGYSSDPANFTDRGYDWSVGGGLRAGMQAELAKGVRFGLAGQTTMWMTKFDKYKGLYADQGAFDIPPAITAGFSFDVMPQLTINTDYQHIFYSTVDSIADSSNYTTVKYGEDNGPGFGWHDVDVFKIGAEYKLNDIWTLRAGYAFTTNPVQSNDVLINILAPGVVQHHISAGASYKLNDKSSIDFAVVYVPESKVSGTANYGSAEPITLKMHQFFAQVGWTYKF